MGEGFDLIHLLNISLTILFFTAFESKLNFFCFSLSLSSFGQISSSRTSTPMLAKWHAIPEPIIPEPKTATLEIFLFI